MQNFFDFDSAFSVIFGAPHGHNIAEEIVSANSVKIATAFGHMSGWRRLEDSILKSKGAIKILVGQAFFQTEPSLLLRLKELGAEHRRIQARLAPATQTFHPKLWLIHGNQGEYGLVGSSNLSLGGLHFNVEANLYTADPVALEEMTVWFEIQWKGALTLDATFIEKYIKKYDSLKQTRDFSRGQLDGALDELAHSEVIWRKTEALSDAESFWKTDDGKIEVGSRVSAIEQMRQHLDFPSFNFGVPGYERFIRIPELGRIRLAHVDKTLRDLKTLRSGLAALRATENSKAIAELLKTKGVGPNVASKLMAIYDPDRFFVINAPVARALASFGYPVDQLSDLDATKYINFLKALEPFREVAQIARLQPAAALDAFFYEYRGHSSE